MSKKSNHSERPTIFQAGVLKIDDAGNIDAGGGNIDNAKVMQTETMSIGNAESNVAASWDGESLNLNAADGEGTVRISGLADPKDNCDAVTKSYVDRMADCIVDAVVEQVLQWLQSGTAVKY